VTVVVTRAKTQASELTEKLAALGANAVGVAVIEIAAPVDGGVALTEALRSSGGYSQIVVASPNGAGALAASVAAIENLDVEMFPPVACVGPSTAAKLADSPLKVNFVPDRAVAEGLVDVMPEPVPGHDRLLLVQAEVARDVLEVGLGAKGWTVDRVTAYRTVDADVTDADRALAGSGDVITFTSSSTVERFVRLVGTDSLPPLVVSIGPVTSQTAHELGVVVDLEADPHTTDGLVAVLTTWASTRLS
jgi:uroporphyrinogen III methyltransferase/synthase